MECAYVASSVTEASYFATPLKLGPYGVEANLGKYRLFFHQLNQKVDIYCTQMFLTFYSNWSAHYLFIQGRLTA